MLKEPGVYFTPRAFREAAAQTQHLAGTEVSLKNAQTRVPCQLLRGVIVLKRVLQNEEQSVWKREQMSLLGWLHGDRQWKGESFWVVCSFLELCPHRSAPHSRSSGAAEGSGWCHGPGTHPGSFAGALRWPRLDLVLWAERLALRDAAGAGLFSPERRGMQVLFAEAEMCVTARRAKPLCPKSALWVGTEMAKAPLWSLPVLSDFSRSSRVNIPASERV